MKKWLLQTSTIGGLIGLAINGIQLAQHGGGVLTIVLGVLSAALLLVNDGKFLKGLAPVLLLGFVVSACASIPLPIETQKQIAVEAACVALAQEQCLNSALATVGITHDNCGEKLIGIANGVETINLKALVDTPRKCKRAIKDIQKLTR
jgi:hypothetical protein